MKNFISIALILVGLIGIFMLYQKQDNTPSQVVSAPVINKDPEIKEMVISVAIAKEDLTEKMILTSDDFQLGTIKVLENSQEKRIYDLNTNTSIIGYALNAPIAKNAFIPVTALVEPGSHEYVDLFKQPGTIIYTFNLQKGDQYLVDNLKSGEYVDIFLAYERNHLSGGINEYISPGGRNNVNDVYLKPVMMHKRVLSLKKFPGIGNESNGNVQLIVEISDIDMKIIKALEGRSKFVLFPSLPDDVEIDIKSSLPEKEENWPVSDATIFNTGIGGIREIRG